MHAFMSAPSTPASRSPLPPAPGANIVRALGFAAVAAIVCHALARLWLLSEGRYFATEDDGYRAYYGYLTAEGTGSLIGRFWVPGQFFALGALGRLGLDAASAPLALGTISFVITIASVRSLAKDLAPQGWGEAAGHGAVIVGALSPLVLVLSHSALAEPFANALSAAAAAALVHRHKNGSRRLVLSGALALMLATWVRYETWLHAALYVTAAYAMARRRDGARVALGDGALASIALLGPLGWLLAQYLVHGDAFAFLETIDEMSEVLAGSPSRARVAALRGEALALWAGSALVWSAAAIVRGRGAGRALVPLLLVAAIGVPGLALEIGSGRGLGVFIIGGREFDFFSPRLVSHVELALFPLAGLGVALVAARATTVDRVGATLLSALTAGLLLMGAARPMTFVDPSSVQAGVMLRRGQLDGAIGEGALLVERVEPRPPMGWAALSVLWSRWDRTVFFTRRGAACDLVEPTDVVDGRVRVPCAELGHWSRRRGVTAAWVLSEPARALFDSVWPEATERRIGEGRLLVVPETQRR